MKKFLVASASEILSGSVTDAYLNEQKRFSPKQVRTRSCHGASCKTISFARLRFGVLAGTYEVLKLLEGLP